MKSNEEEVKKNKKQNEPTELQRYEAEAVRLSKAYEQCVGIIKYLKSKESEK